MEFKLMNYKELSKNLNLEDLPSNIEMYYDLSYKLSTYIFDYRINNKLSQTALAGKLGVKQAMVSKLESGNYNISLENLCNVMAKLNTKIKIKFESFDDRIEDSLGKSSEQDKSLFNIKDLEELGLAS